MTCKIEKCMGTANGGIKQFWAKYMVLYYT